MHFSTRRAAVTARFFRRRLNSLQLRAGLRTLSKLKSNELEVFTERYFQPGIPVSFKDGTFSDSLPAVRRWVEKDPSSGGQLLNNEYFRAFDSVVAPLEITTSLEEENTRFDRIEAPLSLFLTWCRDTLQNTDQATTIRIYVAQWPIISLPDKLQSDLPTPLLVQKSGRGDVYDSSVWLGIPPTYTPLHRDPNPNLFVQVAGDKKVRLMPQTLGESIYWQLQTQIGKRQGSSRIRGEEMMSGVERKVLEDLVWSSEFNKLHNESTYEVSLQPGEGLFIPTGWWHSFKGVGSGINVSANWWFR